MSRRPRPRRSDHPVQASSGHSHPRQETDDRLGALLARPVAAELLDLICDVEGEADEDLLDEAASAIASAVPGRLPTVPRGSLVLRLRPAERDELVALIAERPVNDSRIAKVGERLGGLLARRPPG
jgi:hypothetical protein